MAGGSIAPVREEDLDEIRALITAAVRAAVTPDEEEIEFLVEDIGNSLDWWRDHPERAIHLKYHAGGRILGVILIKDFWNLANLFVLPSRYRQGIGRALVSAVLPLCREAGDRPCLRVNSSGNATGFYRALGFHQTGPGIARAGGCIPFEYELQD